MGHADLRQTLASSNEKISMAEIAPKTHWDHVHQCIACGHALRIDQIDLKIIAVGVITCPKCESSAPVNVKIMDQNVIPNDRPYLHRNGQ